MWSLGRHASPVMPMNKVSFTPLNELEKVEEEEMEQLRWEWEAEKDAAERNINERDKKIDNEIKGRLNAAKYWIAEAEKCIKEVASELEKKDYRKARHVADYLHTAVEWLMRNIEALPILQELKAQKE